MKNKMQDQRHFLLSFGPLSGSKWLLLSWIIVLAMVVNGCRKNPPVFQLEPETVYWHEGIAVGIALPPTFKRHSELPLWLERTMGAMISVEISSKPMASYEDQFDPITMEILKQEEIWREEPLVNGANAINLLMELDTDVGRQRFEYLVFPVGNKTVEVKAEFDADANDSTEALIHQSIMTARPLADRAANPTMAFGFGIHEDSTEMVLDYTLGEDLLVYRDPQLPGQERRPIKIFLERHPGNLGIIDTSDYESNALYNHVDAGLFDGFYVQNLTINGIRTTIRFGRFGNQGEWQLWLFLQQIWFTPAYTYVMFGQSLNHSEDHHAIMRAFASGFYIK